MPENIIAPAEGENLRPGETLRLKSLAPKFEASQHQLYYDLLLRAVTAPDTRNVALTGAYGTGKSSVLDQLTRDYPEKVLKLSLSTIAPTTDDPREDLEGADSRTNQIQKEIVKQLLYRLSMDDTPQSRFQRLTKPNIRQEWTRAAIAGISILAAFLVFGLIQPMVENLLPTTWRQVLAYILLLPALILAFKGVITLVRGRPVMDAAVQAGPATINLSSQSQSYFDKYLDEIIYFFQISKTSIVLIEDIDRFEDVQIFDTLRALNALLNGAAQVGRTVVFVYAIRDSVFEQIGKAGAHTGPQTEATTVRADRAKATLERASRTKFFDVIIPIVPFVSADNARDIMSTAMKSTDFKISPSLIRLAARYVADMRLIDNVRNEFEIYRDRLLLTAEKVPNITEDLIFAVVLFKNTHLADFEKIRQRESTLDRLYSIWRELVQSNLLNHTRALAELRQKQSSMAARATRAEYLGRRLEAFRETLENAAGGSPSSSTATLSGPISSDSIADIDRWAEVADGTPQQVVVTSRTSVTLFFTAAQLTEILRASVNPDDWIVDTHEDLATQIDAEEAHLDFLRHHTWQTLCAKPEYRLNVQELKLRDKAANTIDGQLPFDQIVDSVLESDLARGLVRHGFLTSHFALHAASYYGQHLGPKAMEYIHRCIEPGVTDPSFPLSSDEVVQILREQNATTDDDQFFGDSGVFNVNIMDHLLTARLGAAKTAAHRLSRLGVKEKEFLDTYVIQGEHPAELLAAISPYWSGAVQYAAVTAGVDPTIRPSLLDAALGAIPSDTVIVDGEVAQVFEQRYLEIGAITKPSTKARADIVFSVLAQSGAMVPSLAHLNGFARDAAIRRRLYPLTEKNIRSATNANGKIGLDTMREVDDVYKYALDHLGDYLNLARSTPQSVRPVVSPSHFAEVLQDFVDSEAYEAALLEQLIGATSNEFRVDKWADVPQGVWPFLAAANRLDPTFDILWMYVKEFGVDEHIGAVLRKRKKVSECAGSPQGMRLELAVKLLEARNDIPSTVTRVGLASSLLPGIIPARLITPEAGDLVARLIKKHLITDDATAFAPTLMVDWDTYALAIKASKNYHSFVSTEILSARDLPNLLASPIVPTAVKNVVLADIRTYMEGAPPAIVSSIGRVLPEIQARLPYVSLEALRSAGLLDAHMVSLIALSGDRLSRDDLKELLRSMGGKYAVIADRGLQRPTFPVDTEHDVMLTWLMGDTIEKIELQTFKTKGRRLVVKLLP